MIKISGHLKYEDSGYYVSLIPHGYVQVHHDFDRDLVHYAPSWQAPFLRLFYWYLNKRFIIERTLIHHNVFRCEEGIHCSAWEMNWNVRTWSWHYKSGRYAKRT